MAGVGISVTDPSGAVVAEGVTDDKGVAKIPVPSDGEFTVTIDEATLPDGLGLPADGASRTVNVTAGLGGNANFNLGAAAPKADSKLSLLPKTIFNGIRFGLVIAIMSVGLSLIYATTGLSNFAHGETVTIGAVMTAVASGWFTLSTATGAGVASSSSWLRSSSVLRAPPRFRARWNWPCGGRCAAAASGSRR